MDSNELTEADSRVQDGSTKNNHHRKFVMFDASTLQINLTLRKGSNALAATDMRLFPLMYGVFEVK